MGRPKKKAQKASTVAVRCYPEEADFWRGAARLAGEDSLSDWMRNALNAAAVAEFRRASRDRSDTETPPPRPRTESVASGE